MAQTFGSMQPTSVNAFDAFSPAFNRSSVFSSFSSFSPAFPSAPAAFAIHNSQQEYNNNQQQPFPPPPPVSSSSSAPPVIPSPSSPPSPPSYPSRPPGTSRALVPKATTHKKKKKHTSKKGHTKNKRSHSTSSDSSSSYSDAPRKPRAKRAQSSKGASSKGREDNGQTNGQDEDEEVVEFDESESNPFAFLNDLPGDFSFLPSRPPPRRRQPTKKERANTAAMAMGEEDGNQQDSNGENGAMRYYSPELLIPPYNPYASHAPSSAQPGQSQAIADAHSRHTNNTQTPSQQQQAQSQSYSQPYYPQSPPQSQQPFAHSQGADEYFMTWPTAATSVERTRPPMNLTNKRVYGPPPPPHQPSSRAPQPPPPQPPQRPSAANPFSVSMDSSFSHSQAQSQSQTQSHLYGQAPPAHDRPRHAVPHGHAFEHTNIPSVHGRAHGHGEGLAGTHGQTQQIKQHQQQQQQQQQLQQHKSSTHSSHHSAYYQSSDSYSHPPHSHSVAPVPLPVAAPTPIANPSMTKKFQPPQSASAHRSQQPHAPTSVSSSQHHYSSPLAFANSSHPSPSHAHTGLASYGSGQEGRQSRENNQSMDEFFDGRNRGDSSFSTLSQSHVHAFQPAAPAAQPVSSTQPGAQARDLAFLDKYMETDQVTTDHHSSSFSSSFAPSPPHAHPAAAAAQTTKSAFPSLAHSQTGPAPPSSPATPSTMPSSPAACGWSKRKRSRGPLSTTVAADPFTPSHSHAHGHGRATVASNGLGTVVVDAPHIV